MPSRDPRIDAYITKAPDFAKPILRHLREVVHAACPDVEETVKWGHPWFMRHGMLCNFAAFKQHAAFGFWKASHILEPKVSPAAQAMGSFGRLTSVKDLPSKRVLTGYIRQAVKLNEAGTAVARPKRAPKPAPSMPPDLLAALRKNRKALAHFDKFSPSKQREYNDWLAEAKTSATRDRRLQTAVGWIAEGKARNWKYEQR
jgi:uncharacterized protein YdeI (YjbR/CyaY-like superfamily)